MGRPESSVSTIGGDAGTSSRARLALTGDEGPASVFVKMPAATAGTRLMGELGRLAAASARRLAARTDIPVENGRFIN
jgi:hypothetical protein